MVSLGALVLQRGGVGGRCPGLGLKELEGLLGPEGGGGGGFQSEVGGTESAERSGETRGGDTIRHWVLLACVVGERCLFFSKCKTCHFCLVVIVKHEKYS